MIPNLYVNEILWQFVFQIHEIDEIVDALFDKTNN